MKELKVFWIKGDFLTKEDKQQAKEQGLSTDEAVLLPITHKDRFFAMALALKGLVDKSNMGANWDTHEKVIIEIKGLVNSLNYLINSTSFRRGDNYHDFDKQEVDRKLGR